MPTEITAKCNRPTCQFTRSARRRDDGRWKKFKFCSAECSVYMARAHKALRDNDGAEAAELLRLGKMLDARRTKYIRVDEILRRDPEAA